MEQMSRALLTLRSDETNKLNEDERRLRSHVSSAADTIGVRLHLKAEGLAFSRSVCLNCHFAPSDTIQYAERQPLTFQ